MAIKGQELNQYRDIENKLTKETLKFNNDFFSLYKSSDGYRSALGYLFHKIMKYDARDLIKDDYDLIVTTQALTFLKYFLDNHTTTCYNKIKTLWVVIV